MFTNHCDIKCYYNLYLIFITKLFTKTVSNNFSSKYRFFLQFVTQHDAMFLHDYYFNSIAVQYVVNLFVKQIYGTKLWSLTRLLTVPFNFCD